MRTDVGHDAKKSGEKMMWAESEARVASASRGLPMRRDEGGTSAEWPRRQ